MRLTDFREFLKQCLKLINLLVIVTVHFYFLFLKCIHPRALHMHHAYFSKFSNYRSINNIKMIDLNEFISFCNL